MTGSWDVAALARRIANGELSADTGLEQSIAAIEAHNGRLGAIVDFDPTYGRAQVAALRARIAAGENLPLAGIPVAIKDHIWVEGLPCTQGSLLFRGVVAPRDDPAVARLRRAGAIVVGRTNMSEFGCKGVTTNLVYGATRHPMDPSLTPGGSSGGAASAVASGMVPLALASDGGGSIRRPAAHVGVTGYKPSTGVVPDPRAFSHTAVLGVIAADVAAAHAMAQVLAGHDPSDPVSVKQPLSVTFRLGWSSKLGLDVPVDTDVVQALSGAIDRLLDAGLEIAEADPKWPEGAGEDALMPLQHAELAETFGARWRAQPELFDPEIGRQIESGLALSGFDVIRAGAMGLDVARAMAAFFAAGPDLVLAPTTPCVAWALDKLGPERIGGTAAGPRGHAVFTPLINHAFCPAISLPAGTGRDGLPVGLQVIGPRFSDAIVFHAAAAIADILRP